VQLEVLPYPAPGYFRYFDAVDVESVGCAFTEERHPKNGRPPIHARKLLRFIFHLFKKS